MRDHPPDPRVQRTRQMLREALLLAIRERGMSRLSVQDIAARAMVSRATFYLHYHDAYDLLEQTSRDALARLRATLLDCLAPPLFSPEGFARYVRVFEDIAENAQWYRLMLIERREEPHAQSFRQRMHQILLEFSLHSLQAVQPDERKLSAPRELAARFLASGWMGVIVWWLAENMPYAPGYLAEQMLRLRTLGPYRVRPDTWDGLDALLAAAH
ncbi:MAG: TetR/AcrR family transcriptional regulator [Alicyclobacillaceae bacterium]|nr:TetR/AcrR family transcriptional regulator [Alicyclobacillaceae bacterium]